MAIALQPGVTAFKRIQCGREDRSERGTAVTTNRYLYGTLQLTPNREFYLPEEDRNSLAQIHRATAVSYNSDMRFEGSLQFETFPIFLDMAVFPIDTEKKVGTGSALRERAYSPNMRSRNEPNSYTIQFGDNYAGYSISYVMCSNLELRWEMNDVIMLSADLFGRFPTNVATTTLSSPDRTVVGYDTISTSGNIRVTDAVSQLTDVYINTASTAYSTTLATSGGEVFGVPSTGSKPGVMSALTMSLPTGIEPVRYSSGSLDFTDFSEMKRAFDLDFTLRHNADGAGEYAAYTNETFRFYQLRVTGNRPIYGTGAGAVYPVIDFRFCCQYIESPQFFTDGGGDNLFTIRARSIHDPSWDRDMEIFTRTSAYAPTG